ncbi:MAG TPA: hypothetical protein VFZ59_03950 [Verrucomicrobiae bacterium]|nr:hypothetical protein [Verrucomicrobiae bacterium]
MDQALKIGTDPDTLAVLKSTSEPARRSVSIDGFLEVGSMLCGVGTVTAFLGKLWWLLELSSHFPLHLAAASGLFTGIWTLKRRRRWALFTGVVTGINAMLVLAILWPASQATPAGGQRLRLLIMNVHTANPHTDLVLDFVERTDADAVLLMEVNDS